MSSNVTIAHGQVAILMLKKYVVQPYCRHDDGSEKKWLIVYDSQVTKSGVLMDKWRMTQVGRQIISPGNINLNTSTLQKAKPNKATSMNWQSGNGLV